MIEPPTPSRVEASVSVEPVSSSKRADTEMIKAFAGKGSYKAGDVFANMAKALDHRECSAVGLTLLADKLIVNLN